MGLGHLDPETVREDTSELLDGDHDDKTVGITGIT